MNKYGRKEIHILPYEEILDIIKKRAKNYDGNTKDKNINFTRKDIQVANEYWEKQVNTYLKVMTIFSKS